MNSAVSSLNQGLSELGENINSLTEKMNQIRDFYELFDIPNQLEDGTVSLLEKTVDLSRGISVEFKNVSFSYSGNEELALKNVSFEIGQGHLCVSSSHLLASSHAS